MKDIKYSDLSTWNDWDIECVLHNFARDISKCKTYQEEDAIEAKYVKLIKLQVINESHIMTIEDFAKAVEHGAFNCYDGFGCYMDENGEESGISVCFDPDSLLLMREEYPYVAWYNK